MRNKFHWRKIAITTLCLLLATTTILAQRRQSPLEGYVGNWAFGTTTRFHVGDPFDGFGQVEVVRSEQPTQKYGKDRIWTLNGKRIKPGEIFTKAGKFIMTIESNSYKAAYHVEILPAMETKESIARVVSNNALSTSPSAPSTKREVKLMTNGLYKIKMMNNYLYGGAVGRVLLDKENSDIQFIVKKKGHGLITIQSASTGKYLGIQNQIKDGIQVGTVKEPFLWRVYFEKKPETYSLRPSKNTSMLLNASGAKIQAGTPIILSTYKDLNAPNHAELHFVLILAFTK